MEERSAAFIPHLQGMHAFSSIVVYTSDSRTTPQALIDKLRKSSVRFYSQFQKHADVFYIQDVPGTERWNDINRRSTGYRSALTSSWDRSMREARRICSRRGLPLCRSHAPGSLGIVKIGISILISSISIPKSSFSFKFTPYPKLSGRCWLGARILDNAGFKPVGTVTPLIAMDGTRYMAETRLMEILKEKHIKDPERLSVEWKSAEWNVMLVLYIMVAAVCSRPHFGAF